MTINADTSKSALSAAEKKALLAERLQRSGHSLLAVQFLSRIGDQVASATFQKFPS